MKVTIDNREIELKSTFRAHILYEEITDEPFNPKGLKQILLFFYSTIMASCTDLELDFDGFMAWMDANPQELDCFTSWLVAVNKRNAATDKGESKGKGSKKK